ncbi:MAG TPA: ATP synthase subunit I [Pyrinomonadaceae bacterium]|nr:ATP synthase subunit I [Pyrinomonadaceae bacterium]
MAEIVDSLTGDEVTSRNASALEARMLRTMILTIIAAVAIAAALAPWRITTGLLLGGVLSILNYRWLHSSATAIINLNVGLPAGSPAPRAHSIRYVLRYAIVAAAVFTAYQLNIVSLAATIAGLCSFVPALMVEAFRQFYFIIIHREESI